MSTFRHPRGWRRRVPEERPNELTDLHEIVSQPHGMSPVPGKLLVVQG